MRSIERDLPGRPARGTWAGRTPDRPGRSTGETGRADDGWSAYPQPDRAGSCHPITTGATLPRRPAAAAPAPGSGNRRSQANKRRLSGRTKVRSVSPNSTAGILAKQRIPGLGRDASALMRYLRGALRGWVALDNVAATPPPNHRE